MDVDEVFERLWADYAAMAPRAARLKRVFEERGEHVANDHVAFRTLARPPIDLERLERHVLALGYRRLEPYAFPAKHLRAYGYVPPREDLPRIFLSELQVDELSPVARDVLDRCAAQVDPVRCSDVSVLWAGRLWEPIAWRAYQELAAESEYAAWVAAIGIRPNHFTISVDRLRRHREVEDVLRVVEEQGIPVNERGGRVKGSPAALLEQGSTMADRMPVAFADGETHEIPTCYYEFAKRYRDANGELFQGFVAASADRIFESTDRGRRDV